MKTQLTKTKINGQGHQQDQPRNLAHLLSKRFAILPGAPPATPQPVNPTADQKPEPSSRPSPQLESTLCVNRQPGATLERVANLTPQPPSPCDTAETNLEPKIGTLNSSARTRTGKIARLPLEIREIVNGMLRGGFRYNDIVEYLKELGHPSITPGNITFWRHHGYIDWLNHQHELEAQAVFAKSIEHCIRSLDINHVQQSAIAFAADQLRQIMIQFNPRRALDLLNSRPELFPSFVNAIGTLSRSTSQLANAFDTNKTIEGSLRQQPRPPVPPREVEFEDESAPLDGQAPSVSPITADTNAKSPATPVPIMSKNTSNPNQSQVILSNLK